MGVVEADIQRRARRGGDDVRGGIADVDGGQRQGRGVEMRRAAVQPVRGEAVEQAHQPGQRVAGAFGIGGVALPAGGGQLRGQRAAAADLDRLAHMRGAGRLADEAVVHALIVGGHPVEERDGAVGGVAFLVAGDRQDHAAARRAGGDEVDGGGREGGDAGLHVGGAATVEHAVLDGRGERVVAPGGSVAGRHHVGVAVEAERRAGRAPAGEEVGDAAAVDADGAEAASRQPPVEQRQRPRLGRGDRGAADQRGGELDGIGHAARAPLARASSRGGGPGSAALVLGMASGGKTTGPARRLGFGIWQSSAAARRGHASGRSASRCSHDNGRNDPHGSAVIRQCGGSGGSWRDGRPSAVVAGGWPHQAEAEPSLR